MKVIAYETNCCCSLKKEDDVYGVLFIPDLFDTYNSFKTVNPDKATVHYCVQCYSERVTDLAGRHVRRKNNEAEYQNKLKEFAYIFKKSLFSIRELEHFGK